MQEPGIEVDVGPLEPEHFALAQPERKRDRRVPGGPDVDSSRGVNRGLTRFRDGAPGRG